MISFFFSEHGLNQKNIKSEHSWHHFMCMYSQGTFSRFNYNIHNEKNEYQKRPWRQYGGTSFTTNKNYRSRKANHGDDSHNTGK